jgi:hypothetical protein
MVSDKISRDAKPCYYLVEQKESYCLPVIFERWHSFDPPGEVFYCYDDIVVPPC